MEAASEKLNTATLYITSLHFSKRLRYVLDVIFKDWFQVDWQPSSPESAHICYGLSLENALNIPSCGLLDESEVRELDIKRGHWKELPTFFAVAETLPNGIPFDLLSGVFYFISRYEEYLPFEPDEHGRFAHTHSLLFREQLLDRPIIDEWIEQLRQALNKGGRCSLAKPTYRAIPTYDLDIAWKWKNHKTSKAWGKLISTALRSPKSLITLTKVMQGKVQDPYDSFDQLNSLHEELNLQPIWFVLCPRYSSAYDKNNERTLPSFSSLLITLARQVRLGLHPSYNSYHNRNVLKDEREFLEHTVQKPITCSRQHYIRLQLPHTYQELIEAGIKEEFSMGFTDYNGFRAGTSRSFRWYDLSLEKVTDLRIHPFVFMDTAAFFKAGKNAEEAEKEMVDLQRKVAIVGGTFVTVFHNFSLGSDPQWDGWWEMYQRFWRTTL